MTGAPGVANGLPSGLVELRSLLLGGHVAELDAARARIAALERRLADLDAHTDLTGRALPAAVRLNAGADTELQRALQPDVEQVLHRSVREQPDRMAEAIYPVMGPVVRKIVEKLFERSAEPGTGSQNVEQLFLIHRKSGLLLSHVGDENVASADPDMVSGMLSALRSYVHEAFGTEDFDGLRRLDVGDVAIRVEWGPLAVLAAVVRGVEPAGLSGALESTLADVHREHEDALLRYAGDESEFAPVPLKLRAVLDAHAPVVVPVPWWRRHALALAMAVALALLAWFAVGQRDAARWDRYLARLSSEPGVVVVDAASTGSGYRLHVLVDADARDPLALLPRGAGLDPERIEILRTPWFADAPGPVLARAKRALEAPEGSELQLSGRELSVAASAPDDWFERASRLAPAIPGVERLVRRGGLPSGQAPR